MLELFSPQRNSHLYYFVNSHYDCGSVYEEAERRIGSRPNKVNLVSVVALDMAVVCCSSVVVAATKGSSTTTNVRYDSLLVFPTT